MEFSDVYAGIMKKKSISGGMGAFGKRYGWGEKFMVLCKWFMKNEFWGNDHDWNRKWREMNGVSTPDGPLKNCGFAWPVSIQNQLSRFPGDTEPRLTSDCPRQNLSAALLSKEFVTHTKGLKLYSSNFYKLVRKLCYSHWLSSGTFVRVETSQPLWKIPKWGSPIENLWLNHNSQFFKKELPT